jgi:hypothetical protein
MKGKMRQNINEVNLAVNSDWTTTNLNLLKENYLKSPYFNTYFPKIRDIYLTDFVRMMDMNMAFLEFFFELFELRVNKVFSSDLNVDGHKNQRVINLVKAVGSIHYLSGIGARDYLDEEMFADEGITVEWQKFNHQVYPQLHGEFIPNLSCIDLLFNCGPNSKDILWSCKEVK